MDFPLPAGNSRRRRRLKKPGADAPGFAGVWGRSATNKRASVYTEALLAATLSRFFALHLLQFPGKFLSVRLMKLWQYLNQ